MSDTAIDVISLGVTLVGLVISWGVYRRRGAASGMRGAALSLVPLAAAMTGVTEFFVDLAFSPVKWAGVALTGLAVLLYLTSGAMLSRRAGGSGGGGGGKAAAGGAGEAKSAGRGGKAKGEVGGARPSGDPELAEIEKILRDRGIS
jgi:membrane protein implicated in regulation of membrane protease activity